MPTIHAADEAAIREQAYYFWEAEGRPAGRETEFWERATVALATKSQLETLVKPAPKGKAVAKPKAAAKPKAPLKAAASKTKPVPAKAEPAKKPKKK